MLAFQFDRFGSLDSLALRELPRPVPGPGEALVEVRAAGLNPSDVKNVLGRFPYTTLPRVPGRDFAGVVVEGPAALLGREVWGTGKEPGFFRDGSHAQFLALPADGLADKPRSLSFAQAAACGVPYTTAFDALERCGVGHGTRLVVIGAAGAVGSAAVAIARSRGARVLAAVRKPAQAAPLGEDALLLGDATALPESLKARFGALPEVIFDTTGAWLPAAIHALAPFGRVAVIAAPRDGRVEVPVLDLYRRGGQIVGVNSLLYDTRACAKMLAVIGAAFDDGTLAPPPAPREVPLSAALAAYAEVDRGSGDKIVFTT